MTSLNSMFNSILVGRLLRWKQGDEDDTWKSKAVDVLTKKINRAGQSENLIAALKHKREDTPCVTLDRSKDGRLQVMHRKMLPQVMYCRIFRWPDLQSQHELRSVPSCQWPAHNRDLQEICVNPYHYTRVDHSSYPPVVCQRNNDYTDASPPPHSPMSPESNHSSQQQSPPYLSRSAFPPNQLANPNDSYNYFANQPQLQNFSQQVGFTNYNPNMPTVYGANSWYNGALQLMGAPSQENMQPTGSDPRMHSSPLPAYSDRENMSVPMEVSELDRERTIALHLSDQNCWCKIFYFELNNKVGEPFSSSAPVVTVNGYTNPTDPNKFSLGSLTNPNRSRPVELTRNFIGRGITLEDDGAHTYVNNVSDQSVFFCSKICNIENQLQQHTVVKSEPGKRYKIFDHKIFEDLLHEAFRDDRHAERLFSLVEHCVIRLSFVKGWGSIYKRQEATATPCWIEIHLLKAYALIDQYLQQVKPNSHITSTS